MLRNLKLLPHLKSMAMIQYPFSSDKFRCKFRYTINVCLMMIGQVITKIIIGPATKTSARSGRRRRGYNKRPLHRLVELKNKTKTVQ